MKQKSPWLKKGKTSKKCCAKTKNGNQCNRYCTPGIPYAYCWQHLDLHCHNIATKGIDLLGNDIDRRATDG